MSKALADSPELPAAAMPRTPAMPRAAAFYRLTKPGIVYSNVMTAAAGLLFACRLSVDYGLLLALLAGTGLIIASACVYNNYIDRPIDRKMRRTRGRASVTGQISLRAGLLYGSVLGAVGFAVLTRTNAVTVLAGVLAWLLYVVVYGVAKRRSPHGTLVGTLPGAASLVAGYTAVAGRFDTTALLLGLIMVAWQMAHFYAIALYRQEDYRAAGLPVWPVRYGARSTKHWIMAYIAVFVLANGALVIDGVLGPSYMAIMVLLGGFWLWRGAAAWTREPAAWGRRMFGVSLIVLLSLSVALPLGRLLP